jgi:PAS domain S-box-containing protein
MRDDKFPIDDAFLTRELLGVAFEAAGVAVWTVDPTDGGVAFSSSMKRMLGIAIDAPIDRDGFLALPHPDDREAVRACVAAAFEPDGAGACEAEFRVEDNRAGPRWFALNGRTIFRGAGAHRRPELFVGTLRDITGRKNADAALQAALDQQRELLHEVNHRVKNSLQLVSSLLRLQARRAPDQAMRHQLEDATARISTIARIHERLYRDQDSKRIRFKAFLAELCSDLQGSAPRCSLRVQSAEFSVATERAIPLGLVINELVSNALKYAYPDGEGPVTVTAGKSAEGDVTVSVGDNGVGLPDGFSVAPGALFIVTASAGD